jgi:hypothetical protein
VSTRGYLRTVGSVAFHSDSLHTPEWTYPVQQVAVADWICRELPVAKMATQAVDNSNTMGIGMGIDTNEDRLIQIGGHAAPSAVLGQNTPRRAKGQDSNGLRCWTSYEVTQHARNGCTTLDIGPADPT